jgi:hypothetical protein
MEPKSSLPCSQEPISATYPVPEINILSLFSLSVRKQVSHPYKTTVLYIFNLPHPNIGGECCRVYSGAITNIFYNITKIEETIW